jgi:hypothetical protein
MYQVASTTIIAGATIALLERWHAHSAGDASLDIAEEMMHLTTGNFCQEIDIFVSSKPKWQIPRKI